MTPKGPHIDWAGLSPLVALLGGATVVLLVGLLRPRFIREHVVPALALLTTLATAGLTIFANSLRFVGTARGPRIPC